MNRSRDDTHIVKPLRFVSGSREELLELPEEVRRSFGHELYMVQRGETPVNASPFEGSIAANVMKLVERYEGDTYRCVYVARFEKAVYVLHAFKKKSKSGIATPRKDIEIVQKRYDRAEESYRIEFE